MQNQDTPVISFIGNSGSGKTTLLEQVVLRLKADGVRVAVIKHSFHGFEMDHPGRDSWRMTQAGADIVVISTSVKVAVIETVSEEKSLDEIIGALPRVDLILTEGYKREGRPAIEVYRSETGKELLTGAINRLAIASDVKWDVGVPCYHIDDVDGVVSEVKKYAARAGAVNG
ncbi:MAG: molybdopterin-guanine dinucleotide biosynthesis protein B [Firmicutes bacterium]|nr:molybdopterin-guanine dinucleotide biosynthesis protein B [Bacillota bacterium]